MLILEVVTLARPATATPVSGSDAAVQRFFSAVRRHDYRSAYELLSAAVQRDLPYEEFARRSHFIRRFAVIEVRALERGPNLVRYRVKGLLRLVYRGSLYDAVYAGRADMSHSGGNWRIAQVDLKPTEQKRIGPAPPEYHI